MGVLRWNAPIITISTRISMLTLISAPGGTTLSKHTPHTNPRNPGASGTFEGGNRTQLDVFVMRSDSRSKGDT